jgi:hypothetical protein
VLSYLVGAVFGVDPTWPELEARTRADFTDVILALSAGAAERARKATWFAIAVWVAMLAALVVLIVIGQVEAP